MPASTAERPCFLLYCKTVEVILVSRWEKPQCSIPPSLEETDKASGKALCQALLIHGCA